MTTLAPDPQREGVGRGHGGAGPQSHAAGLEGAGQVQSDAGSDRKPLERPIIQHRPRPLDNLLGRLEDEDDPSRELSPALRQQPGNA